jgi:hypothetical protein
LHLIVIPAEAGIHRVNRDTSTWIPACAMDSALRRNDGKKSLRRNDLEEMK